MKVVYKTLSLGDKPDLINQAFNPEFILPSFSFYLALFILKTKIPLSTK